MAERYRQVERVGFGSRLASSFVSVFVELFWDRSGFCFGMRGGSTLPKWQLGPLKSVHWARPLRLLEA